MSDFLKGLWGKIEGKQTTYVVGNEENTEPPDSSVNKQESSENDSLESWKRDLANNFFPVVNSFDEVADGDLLKKRLNEANKAVISSHQESIRLPRRPVSKDTTQRLLAEKPELVEKIKNQGGAAKPKKRSKWKLW